MPDMITVRADDDESDRAEAAQVLRNIEMLRAW